MLLAKSQSLFGQFYRYNEPSKALKLNGYKADSVVQSSFTHQSSDAGRGGETSDMPLRLVLRLIDSDRLISVPLADRLVVGRGGDNHLEPDVDLSDYDGATYGISRLHGMFIYQNNQLFIQDLNSVNGTRINGYQITPGVPCRLRKGDELELGALRLSVNLVLAPR